MQKLTNPLRDRILFRVIAAFDKKFNGWGLVEDKLAQEAFESVFPLSLLQTIKSLPDTWFLFTTFPCFIVNGVTVVLKSKKGLPLPYWCNNGLGRTQNTNFVGTVDDPGLTQRITDHLKNKHDLDIRKAEATKLVEQLLQSANTLEVLAKIWPEGSPFYATLPVVPNSKDVLGVFDVNQALGLHT